MSKHTTLKLGGPADLWCRPLHTRSLKALLLACDRTKTPVSVVGSGTNLLVRDGGIRGVVINLGRMNQVDQPRPQDEAECIEVQAGSSTGRLLATATRKQLGGLEFLAGVPGSVGGGLIMNAGTILGEFTDVVSQVHSVDFSGQEHSRDHQACGFSYRSSAIPSHEVVVGATLMLKPTPLKDIKDATQALRARRKEREPSGVRNCGSTFKNPEGDYAGRLIEACGLKGLTHGACVVSEKHANWLVVDPKISGPRRSADYLSLMQEVCERVEQQFAVQLQPELRFLGEDLL